ncbi:hypothetical protein D3C79_1106970 [compost metagenome]
MGKFQIAGQLPLRAVQEVNDVPAVAQINAPARVIDVEAAAPRHNLREIYLVVGADTAGDVAGGV